MELEDFEFNAVYDIEPIELWRLEREYAFSFKDSDRRGELVVFRREEPFPESSHTGRELLLMLAGSKPLAAFIEQYPLATAESFIPEALFNPDVARGRFVKRVEIKKSRGIGDVRRVLYAVPDQQWRIDAYLMLWALDEKYGWNGTYEAAEGYLLGYETDIDPLFAGVLSADPLP